MYLFQNTIFTWWEDHRRDLPWRHTRDPYRIFISEVMLQQTQVSRVLSKYNEFFCAFPNVTVLASTPTSAVLKAWKGMGYNRRALYIKKAAEIIVQHHRGRFPENETLLTNLPGVGRYTARALLVFAFGRQLALVDTNIRQIITHFFYSDVPQIPSVIQQTAEQLVPPGKAWEWHQALMDYGALEMQKVKSKRKKEKGKAIVFRETDRFFRGRIIDLLREASCTYSVLLEHITHTYHKDYAYIRGILDGLQKDGLIECKNNRISLPG